MNRYPLWRYILVLILLVVGILYALPNLYGDSPAVQVSNSASTALTPVAVGKIKARLQQAGLRPESMESQPQSMLIRFDRIETQLKAQDELQQALGPDYSVALNLAPKTPAWLQAIGAEPMKLGLDLRGGIHFLMYVDIDAALQKRMQSDLKSMMAALRQQRIRYKKLESQVSPTSSGLTSPTPPGLTSPTSPGLTGGSSHPPIGLRFRSSEEAEKANTLLQKSFTGYTYKSLPLQRGFYVLEARMTPAAKKNFEISSMGQTLTILRNRVNAIGVSEPVVQQQGKNYISIDLPGIQDSARAKKIIGAAATVQMQLQFAEGNPYLARQTGIVPLGAKLYDFKGRPVLLQDSVVLSGTGITHASAGVDENGRPSVRVSVSGDQASHLLDVTSNNINKPMATVYIETVPHIIKKDGKSVVKMESKSRIINIATIQGAFSTQFSITGMESMQASQNLALLLRSGAYPIAPAIVEEQVVGPSMGQENIDKGEISTAVGFLLVVLFMLFYYRFFGLVADLALIVNLVFIVSIMSMLQATLTLPGIAGIVLTIGMAVDANVLINERIREELRLGMTPQAAINAGYGRAFSTIVDANVTTLIVAVVLCGIGSGPVKNFAVTLIIGLLTSMLSAIFFTRAVVNLTYGYRRKLKALSIGIRVNDKQGEA